MKENNKDKKSSNLDEISASFCKRSEKHDLLRARILWLDYNDLYREKLINIYFKKQLPFYECDTAGTRKEACGLLSERTYDIVMLSRHLDNNPDGGLEVAIKIKEMHPETELVLVTTRPIEEEESMKFGIDHLYLKNKEGTFGIKNMVEGIINSKEVRS